MPQESFAGASAFWAAAANRVTRVTPAMRIGGPRVLLPFGPAAWPAAPHQPAGDIGRRNDAGWRLPAVGRVLDAWSRHVSRLAGRYWRAGRVRLLRRGHGPGYSAAACGLGDPRGEPSGDGNRRVSRARDSD